jgi:hypothetical protein
MCTAFLALLCLPILSSNTPFGCNTYIGHRRSPCREWTWKNIGNEKPAKPPAPAPTTTHPPRLHFTRAARRPACVYRECRGEDVALNRPAPDPVSITLYATPSPPCQPDANPIRRGFPPGPLGGVSASQVWVWTCCADAPMYGARAPPQRAVFWLIISQCHGPYLRSTRYTSSGLLCPPQRQIGMGLGPPPIGSRLNAACFPLRIGSYLLICLVKNERNRKHTEKPEPKPTAK